MMVGPSKEWEWPEETGAASGESFLERGSFLTGESTLVGVAAVGVMSFLVAGMDDEVEETEPFCCSCTRLGMFSADSSPFRVLVLLLVLVGLPSPLALAAAESAISRSVASVEMSLSFSLTFFMSSGCEKLLEVVETVELVERVVVEGAGLNEEEAELTGDGSMEEAESMQRAESSDEVELLRLVEVVLRAFIQECSIH